MKSRNTHDVYFYLPHRKKPIAHSTLGTNFLLRLIMQDGSTVQQLRDKFTGKDVAQSLGYRDTKSALIDHVFPDYKRVLNAKTIQEMASRHKGGDSPPLRCDAI